MSRAPAAGAALHLLIVAALFGSAFLAIEHGLKGLTPFGLAWGRMGIGALVLMVLFGRERLVHAVKRAGLAPIATLGLLTFAAPYTLLGLAEQELDAATVGVCFGAGPAITLLLSVVLEGTVVRLKMLLAVALGVAGATLAAWSAGGPASLASTSTLWVAATLVCYALSGILTRRLAASSAEVPGLLTAALVVATLMSAPALVFLPVTHGPVPAAALAAVAYLGAVPTALGFFARFLLTVRTSVTWASTAGWLVPLFALLWAILFGDASLSVGAAAGIALITLGLAVLRPRRRPTRWGTEQARRAARAAEADRPGSRTSRPSRWRTARPRRSPRTAGR